MDIELIGGKVTNPAAGITACTPLAGQTFAVRSTPEGTKVVLEQMWAQNATGGTARIRSPRMHDNTQGLRVRVPANNARPLLPFAVKEPLYSQDTLLVETSGGAAETDNVFYVVSYDKLPGSESNLKTPAEVFPRVKNYMGLELVLTSGAAAGEWGPARALNAEMDQFKRPSEYALLGYVTSAECGAVAFHGTDIGEVRIGGPGNVEPAFTNEWFVRLSEETGGACIPCFQAGNVNSILAEICHTTAATQRSVTLCLAQLR